MVSPTDKLRRTFVALTSATLLVFGALVFGLTANLRMRLHDQVQQREADAIQAVAQLEIKIEQSRLMRAHAEIAVADVFAAVLESSQLRDVIAVQLFDASGALRNSLPPVEADVVTAQRWWPAVLDGPKVRFNPNGTLEEIFGITPELGAEPTRTPLVDIVVPLKLDHGGRVGIARYWLAGTPIAAEFRQIDRSLFTQAVVAFVGGGALLVLLVAWTYRRLARAQHLLITQSADLRRANEELDFAAKTGALGAISAHLIHGLNNPLAGLEGFVAEATTADDDAVRGEARQTAMDTARRLRALVNDVVTVLRDEATGEADYRVALNETVTAIERRTAPVAEQAGVELGIAVASDGELKARTANLASLVLANLLTNAIEATPRGGNVRLEAARTGDCIVFMVTDTGGGLAPAVQESLFRPVRSTKSGGGGMGLAISHRLARHAGGELTLVRTGAGGTAFRLVVPAT
jgi:signal transduction histidine kinase